MEEIILFSKNNIATLYYFITDMQICGYADMQICRYAENTYKSVQPLII